MGIIKQIADAVKGGAKLEDVIPAGSLLTDWERILNNYANPRKVAKRNRPDNGRGKRSKSRMQSVVNRATLTLVERVNRKEIPFDGSAPDSPDEITGRDYYGV